MALTFVVLSLAMFGFGFSALPLTKIITIETVLIFVKMDRNVHKIPGDNTTWYDPYFGINKVDHPTKNGTIYQNEYLPHNGYMYVPSTHVSINNASTIGQNSHWSNKLQFRLTCNGPYYGTGVKLGWAEVNHTATSIRMVATMLEEADLRHLANYCFVAN